MEQQDMNIEADIVISGIFSDEHGNLKRGALAIKDGCYLDVGECDDISYYIGLDTIMCGYKNKSILAGLYMAATGEMVEETGSPYRSEGDFHVAADFKDIKIGDRANIIVYDAILSSEELESIEKSKILLKIEDGRLVFRKRERVKKAASI